MSRMAAKIPATEFGGADGQFGNIDAGAPVTGYFEALAYRRSVGRIDSPDDQGVALPRTPGYGSAGRRTS